MLTAKFTLTGTMPLLIHSDDVEAADTLTEWRRDPQNRSSSVAGDDRSPPWTWQTYLYSDGESMTIPSQNLMVCLRHAGSQMILKKQKTFKEISQSGLLIRSEFLTLTVAGKQVPMAKISELHGLPFKAQADAVRGLGFRLFLKRAVVGRAKHVRVRARLDEWSVSGEVEVLVPEITQERLETMFGLAGRVGLCDWRPGCKTPGPFGMFEAKLKC
jgi:hypothetical protein